MTDEAGAVTGELQAATSINSGALEVSVRYCEAEEWYTVAGSPAQTRGLSETSHEALHQEVLQALTSAGPVGEINEQPVDLSRLTRQF